MRLFLYDCSVIGSLGLMNNSLPGVKLLHLPSVTCAICTIKVIIFHQFRKTSLVHCEPLEMLRVEFLNSTLTSSILNFFLIICSISGNFIISMLEFSLYMLISVTNIYRIQLSQFLSIIKQCC